jgi:hypothetical protein
MAKERYSVHEAELLAKKYAKITSEKQFAQTFWRDVFQQLCGVDDLLATGIEFEFPVRSHESGTIKFIDVLWPGVVLVEHKSAGESLDKAEQQARDYLISLEAAKRPPVIILSDFTKFRIIEVLAGKSVEFAIGDLPQNVGRFEAIIGDAGIGASRVEIEADTKAANLMSELFVQFEKAGYTGHEVSVFLVRILFLLFGDDTAMWRRTDKGLFSDVVNNSSEDGSGLGAILQELFVTLNTSREKRPTTLAESMSGFPYINGGIFAEQLPNFNFNKSMRTALVAATQYDWSTISPAIFGSLFQSVRDAETRREMGEHYTSETNILRCINDLFLNDFYKRLHESWDSPQALKALRMELGHYNYLDPACGSGNFLVVAYKRMRDIELRIIARLQELDNNRAQLQLDGSLGLQVHLGQFHGIEIDEWSASIARVAMFLADHQANLALEQITGSAPNRFPLTESAVIVNANALRTDWSTVCPMNSKTFIMGNPPFFGARFQSVEQKKDTLFVWDDARGAGDLDFVSNWYLLAAKLLSSYGGRAAFVSTNSIAQGEQPAIIWRSLMPLGMSIDFAHQTFKWSNDASGQAAVHVVIIGFSKGSKKTDKSLWTYSNISSAPTLRKVSNINGYLSDGPDVLIQKRSTPMNPLTPKMLYGSQPNDGGFISDISAEEAEDIRKNDSVAAKYLHRLIGGRELIHSELRYCLWLVDAEPADIRSSKVLSSRVEEVKRVRMESKRVATQKLGLTPTLFGFINQPKNDYLAVPLITSGERNYLSVVQMTPEVISNNKIGVIEDPTMVSFAVLSSRVFTVWNKTVSGRLKSDLNVSITTTYNNFPFLTYQPQQVETLRKLSQDIVDVRTKYPQSTLADLYGANSMPADLLVCHQKLDSAVLETYGLKSQSSDAEVLEVLFRLYSKEQYSSGEIFDQSEDDSIED